MIVVGMIFAALIILLAVRKRLEFKTMVSEVTVLANKPTTGD